jgi:hypothetical protein
MALVVLAVVGVLLVVFGKPRSGSRDVGAMRGTLVVPGFVPDEARLIEVSKSGAETVRVRGAGKDWTVESAWGYPADPERVQSLLQAIEELRVRGVRSRRAASHRDFLLDEAQGLWVRVCGANGKELAKVCAGKSVAYDSCFVRTSGSDDVLEATPNLLQNLGAEGEHKPRPVFFVNKTVLTYEPDNVQRLTLERESGTVVLEKVEAEEPSVNAETGQEQTKPVTKWMIRQPEEEEADENACLSIVNGLSSIIAPDIGGGKTAEECGLAPPKAKVTIEFTQASGKAPVSVLFGTSPLELNRYYAMTGDEGARIFVVSSYYWSFAVKDLNELRKVKREEPAPETTTPETGTEPAEENPKPAEGQPAEETPDASPGPVETPPDAG